MTNADIMRRIDLIIDEIDLLYRDMDAGETFESVYDELFTDAISALVRIYSDFMEER